MNRSPNRSTRGLVIRSSVIALLAAGVVLGTLTRCGRLSSSPLASRSAAPAIYSSAHRTTSGFPAAHLAAIGVTPMTACVAGLSSSEVSALIAAGRQYLTDNGTALDTAEDSVRSAASSVASLEVKASRGLATPEELTQLTTARRDLTSAQSSRDSALNGLRTATLGSLSQAKSTALQTVISHVGAVVPAKYKCMSASESGWMALRDAAAAKRAADLRGGSLTQSASSTLASADADPAVVASSAAMTDNMSGIRSAWTAAME